MNTNQQHNTATQQSATKPNVLPQKEAVPSGIHPYEIEALLHFSANPETLPKLVLWLIGILLTPITLLGTLLGYIRGYKIFMQRYGLLATFIRLRPIIRVAMFFGAIAIWFTLLCAILIFAGVIKYFSFNSMTIIYYLLVNLTLSCIVFGIFKVWKIGVNNSHVESSKFGTAQFAKPEDLYQYRYKPGLYIGDSDLAFSDRGHGLALGPSRSGKGTNIVIPNLLRIRNYQGSKVVLDVKGEISAITKNYLISQRVNVVILNPWDLLSDYISSTDTYNPLEILSDTSSVHLVDDAMIIAEMIVPIDKNSNDRFFADNARAIVCGLILHLVTSQPKEQQTLMTLWKWVRYTKEEWTELLCDMAANDNPVNGEVVRQSANEVLKLMEAGDRTFGSIIATVLQCTDFIKSPALQKNMKSGFKPTILSEGNTVLFIVIPADKLKSHDRYTRLVLTSCISAVVRKPTANRVTFLMDEFATLGYISIMENALSTYAGFNITIFPIIQSYVQLKAIYGDAWETFVGNTSFKLIIGVEDNFTAEYVSKSMGQTSNVIVTRSWFGVKDAKANARALVTPEELIRATQKNIFAFIGGNYPTYFPKKPYYEMPELYQDGKPLFDENPYFISDQETEQAEPDQKTDQSLFDKIREVYGEEEL